MKKTNKLIALVGTVTVSLLLSACGSMNKIDDQGNIVNKDVKWGQIEKNTFNTNGSQPGMWVSKSDISLLQPGMNKSQLLKLLGRPHYNEGFVGVHEWNYIINKNTSRGVEHCQLKVTFDKDMNARQFLWHPMGCMDEPVKEIPVKVPEPKQFELRSDFLFDFDKADVKPSGVQKINQIASEVQKHDYNSVVIVGHTDRLGSEKYNEDLSKRRAVSVSKHFVNAGIPVSKIHAYGAGEENPVKECEGTKATAQLKACLEPNRRVEILVH